MGKSDKDDIDIVKAWSVQLVIVTASTVRVGKEMASIDYTSNEMVHKDILYLHLVGFNMDAISLSIVNYLS